MPKLSLENFSLTAFRIVLLLGRLRVCLGRETDNTEAARQALHSAATFVCEIAAKTKLRRRLCVAKTRRSAQKRVVGISGNPCNRMRSAFGRNPVNHRRTPSADRRIVIDCSLTSYRFASCVIASSTSIPSGIVELQYVEPYPKSRALGLHEDSIAVDRHSDNARVRFRPFLGVSARRYFDLFSMRLSGGVALVRKKEGRAVEWARSEANPRIRLSHWSYIQREVEAAGQLAGTIAPRQDNNEHRDGA